jgi:hypothetical protein
MPISIDQFRMKAQQGDAERLEINSAGTGLHRKGISRSGRVVEWMRDAVGARKAENKKVMHAFVAALKDEYGDAIGGKFETELLGHRSKPLTSRQVRELIDHADTLHTSMCVRNQKRNLKTAQVYAPSEPNDKALGYMSAVAGAAKTTGASDALVEKLLDCGPDSETTGVRDAIREAIEAAGQDGKRVVSKTEARAIAQQEVAKSMRSRMAQEVTLDEPFRPTGPAADTLEQVKAFTAQRLNARLDGSAGADRKARFMAEQELMRNMSAQIGKLDNSALLKLYRTTLSADMVEVRLALANRANDPKARLLLEDLNSYEAMVHTEVIERTLPQPREDDDGFQNIDHGPKGGGLAALKATEDRAFKLELARQTDDYLRGDDPRRTGHPGAEAKLENTGVTIEEVEDALRSADLTINMGLKLFAKGGAFRDKSGKLVTGALRMKNIYDLPQEEKGPDYLKRRKLVEHALEPETAKVDAPGIDPDNHPISAGVNVGRRVRGAAPGYGEVVLILKPSVKARCTYTARDSFKVFEASVTREKIALYRAKVDEMLQPGSDLLKADRKALRDDPTKLNAMFNALEQMVAQNLSFGPDRPFIDEFQRALREVAPEPRSRLNYQLMNAAIDIFRKRPGAGGHVTTSDRMSHLIAGLNKNVLDHIVTGVRDAGQINLPINDYIEAQVYTGVDFASDVAEIRYPPRDTKRMSKQAYDDCVQGLRKMASELGIPVVAYKEADVERGHL